MEKNSFQLGHCETGYFMHAAWRPGRFTDRTFVCSADTDVQKSEVWSLKCSILLVGL